MKMPEIDRLIRGYEAASRILLSEANGHWTGELSSSPLSTATAITALELVRRQQPERSTEFEPLIQRGLSWLADCQNADGGWGDTKLSHSNISTATLCYASFHLIQSRANPGAAGPRAVADLYQATRARAKAYMDQQGGFAAIKKRYGKDHTFSVPILTQCALAGLIPWTELTPLPFELGWLPHWFYRWISLPVVSYALPALIAIGQVRHHFAPSWNPIIRLIRQIAVAPTLRRLTDLQPESGGFLEATPLTSFVTMSLAAMGQAAHPVAVRGVDFLLDSVREDGSWPIDTNLATWVTTLSVNALRSESLASVDSTCVTKWLLDQQHRVVHRYTNAAPGGWAWTNLSGGVPDADDTPGAILALMRLAPQDSRVGNAVQAGIGWLLDLQNRDGGWPTFCRGWGALPFDRSTPDLTAHALRALHSWLTAPGFERPQPMVARCDTAVRAGFAFLQRTQRSDGTWLPLWFGNQHTADEENPTYGVSKALAAYRVWGRMSDPAAIRAIAWLAAAQNEDGSWGGGVQTIASTEESALALEALADCADFAEKYARGLDWLLKQVESDSFQQPAPIGLYFAKLWYFERLYPIIFTVSALARAVEKVERSATKTLPAPDLDFLPSVSTVIQ